MKLSINRNTEDFNAAVSSASSSSLSTSSQSSTSYSSSYKSASTKSTSQPAHDQNKRSLNTLDEFDDDAAEVQTRLVPINRNKSKQPTRRLTDLDDFSEDSFASLPSDSATPPKQQAQKACKQDEQPKQFGIKHGLVVPSEKFANVLGPKSSNLRIIENLTGARLEELTKERIIAIYGPSQEVVEFAQEMIENLVASRRSATDMIDLSTLLNACATSGAASSQNVTNGSTRGKSINISNNNHNNSNNTHNRSSGQRSRPSGSNSGKSGVATLSQQHQSNSASKPIAKLMSLQTTK
jgi:hypothetical protein